jgi:hypothetical protein
MTNRMYQLKREHNNLMWANEINEALSPKQEGQPPEKRRREEEREIKTETGQIPMTAGASTSCQDQNQDTPNTRWNHQRSNPIESIHEYEMALARSLKENNNIPTNTPQQPDFVMANEEVAMVFWKRLMEQKNKNGW